MQMALNLALVGLFGAVGAVCRFGVHLGCRRLFHEERFPLAPLIGTLAVNVLGCFLLGVIFAVPEWKMSPHLRLGIASGFLGALTTFSTFGVETIAQVDEGRWVAAFGNIGLNVGLGLMAAWIGIVVGRSIIFP